MDASTERRLRWRSRRGLLELDILLQRFLDRQGAQLDAVEVEQLQQLLAQPDQSLLAWLTGTEGGIEKEFELIVKKIRQSTVFKD